MTDPPRFAAFERRGAREGFEVAFFRATADGYVVDGHTSAVEEGAPYSVAYTIEVDRQWRTRLAVVRGQSLVGRHETRIELAGDGRWSVDGARLAALDGCLDVDLECSALTNAFPVRRLMLEAGEASEAPAAWVRTLDLSVELLEQRYARIDGDRGGHARFAYEAPVLGFRAELEYDPSGVVVAYPGIAARRA